MPFVKKWKQRDVYDSGWGPRRGITSLILDLLMYDTGREHRERSALKEQISESSKYFCGNYSYRDG